MTAVLRFLLSAIGGAAVGYVCLVIYGNSEDRVFYSLRSWATGQSAMSQIVQPPADWWVYLGVWVALVGGGVMIGILLALRR